jgi:hypothetical protein
VRVVDARRPAPTAPAFARAPRDAALPHILLPMRILDVSFAGDGGRATPPAWLSAGWQAAVPTPANPRHARIASIHLQSPLPADGLVLALRGGFELRISACAGAPADGPVADHVTLCVEAGELAGCTAALRAQLPAAECERHRVGAAADGMDIVGITDAASGVHIVLAAPTGPGGQVADFLADAGCAGLQHIAFAVPDLGPALAALEARGLRFVDGPGAAAIIEEREGGRWLRQAFTETVWGGFFVELVERHGITGLRAANIRSMYDANGRDAAHSHPAAVSDAPALRASG